MVILSDCWEVSIRNSARVKVRSLSNNAGLPFVSVKSA